MIIMSSRISASRGANRNYAGTPPGAGIRNRTGLHRWKRNLREKEDISMKDIFTLTPVLNLFDGEGGEASGEAQAQSPVSTRRGRSGGELDNVKYGIQQEGVPDAGEPEIQVTSDTLEERRQRYRDLVNSEEYKDLYGEDVQRIINQRFKETRGLQEQLEAVSPVVDMLRQRYGIEDGDMDALMEAMNADDGYWEQAAEDAGMSVEQYKEFQRMERELAAANEQLRRQQGQQQANRQMQAWYNEGEALKQLYPSFDIQRESQNPQFLSLLRAGTPMKTAYEVIHMDEIKAGVAQSTARAAEQQITSNIKARGQRPAEAGGSAQASFTVKSDVTKLTKKDRAEIAKRAARGEKISF